MADVGGELDWKSIAKSNSDLPDNLKFKEEDDVFTEEIGDGNLNDVVRVFTKNKDGEIEKSVVVKHSVPYIKCLGKGYPLGVERIAMEYKGLQKFHTVSPGSVPVPYSFDQATHAVFMEDLRGYELLRKLLIRREGDMELVCAIARQLAIVHRETHLATVGQEQLQQLDKEFENENMLSLTRQYVFTRPFTEGDETNRCSPEVKQVLPSIYSDETVLATARRMLQLFSEKKECLVHGDLHTGSILVRGGDARLMDLEFCYMGPAAFDLGMLLANYIFSHYRHMSIPDNNDEGRDFAHKMIEACNLTVSTYLEHMTASIGDREKYVAGLMSETAGFAGCEIIRRIVGAAHVEDLEGLPGAEVDCLGAGVRLLQAAHRIHDIDRMMVIALMLC